ncbi:hypothetical protein VTK26DRAFT_6217 [Humicola hyalothermophila]
MDYPWGSPWAIPDSDKYQKQASPVKSELTPPPHAVLSASSSPRVPAPSEQSPWAGDDEEFGGWAITLDTSTQDEWGGEWRESRASLGSNPRDHGLGTESPVAATGALATPRPSDAPTFPQPSPDPWAGVLNNEISTPRLVVDPASPVDASMGLSESEKDCLDAATDPGWDTAEAKIVEDQTTSSDERGRVSSESASVESPREQEPPVSPCNKEERTSVESSAPSGDNTDHEDERQNSPLTSIDEEVRIRRPISRKTSGKVQELVDKFDGLARAASQDRAPPSGARSTSPLSVTKHDDQDDAVSFGEFEDVDEDKSPAIPRRSASAPSGEESSATDATSDPPQQLSVAPAVSVSPIAKFGPIHFAVDSALVEKLFDSVISGAASIDPQADQEVPDHIITDTFTEISERKTWYRISRYGSSRRHDAGDDESYRRVAWHSSTVHDEAIKIVRRWMEEDSIAGRVSLGGGVSKTQKNMFGWNSSAEPVALDAVFGKKKTHSRASSLQYGNHASLETSETPAKRPLRSQTSGSPGPAVASFGWSSNPPLAEPDTTITVPGPADGAASTQTEVHTPQIPGAPGPSIVGGKQTNAVTTSLLDSAAPQYNHADEDDDEWGEMVSSPVVSDLNANEPAVGGSLATWTISGPKTIALADDTERRDPHSAASGPWVSADISAFDSGRANGAPQVNAPTAATIRETAVAKGVNPTPVQDSFAPPSSPEDSPSGPTVATSSIPSSKPVGVMEAQPPQTAQGNSYNSPRIDLDETARNIIANLPDFSYMLR